MTGIAPRRSRRPVPVLSPAVEDRLSRLGSLMSAGERRAGLSEHLGVTGMHQMAWHQFHRRFRARSDTTGSDTSWGLVAALRHWITVYQGPAVTVPDAVMWLCAEMVVAHRDRTTGAIRPGGSSPRAHQIASYWQDVADHGWVYELAGMSPREYREADPRPTPADMRLLIGLSDLPFPLELIPRSS